MNSLLVRILAVGAAAILCFALVTAAAVELGFDSIVKRNAQENEDVLAEAIAARLHGLRAEDPKIREAVAEALKELPAKTEFLTVVSQEGKTLYQGRKGREVLAMELGARKKPKKDDWYAVASADGGRFRFAFRAQRVEEEEPSLFVLSAIKRTALGGALAAAAAAALVAFLVSRPLSKQAKALASALDALRRGRRDVELPPGGVKELRAIAAGASELQDTLRREEELRRQWTADIAHDLRTPLTVIKGQFEGMLDGVLPVDRGRLERNHQEVLALERLVSQLSVLTRLEAPGYRAEFREIDAAALLGEQAERFADAARERGLGVEASAPEACPVLADGALLDRALSNLIDNAVRHGDAPGTLRLEARRLSGGGVSLSVENPGLIPEEDRPRVFDRLFRGDRSRTRRGDGLGLAIVQAIAGAHGGSVVLESDGERRLTRFVLTLPPAARN